MLQSVQRLKRSKEVQQQQKEPFFTFIEDVDRVIDEVPAKQGMKCYRSSSGSDGQRRYSSNTKDPFPHK